MTLEELNTQIVSGEINETIRVVEARQIKALSRIADQICSDSRLRMVLLAGGSSSGKTTTAKRLCTQIRVNGRAALQLSTDDYFVGDKRNPRNERGEFDYEHIDCVDASLLASDLNALFAGQRVPRRRFDFAAHEPGEPDGEISLADDGFVVLEGIHALNPRLVAGVPDETKFRVHINLQPTFDVFGGIRPTSAESRFLRRMVRDNRFRKMSPVVTLKMWPNVLEGERKWIEPFVDNADVVFNSYLDYELAVLKPYVSGLLARARHEVGEDPLLMNMIRLLNPILPLPDSGVPGNSILREVIGGSQLEY